MDKVTEELIRELAQKLGTTAGHLWEVLIRQAIISSIIDIIVIAAWIFSIILMYKFISGKTTKKHPNEKPEWGEEMAYLAWIVFVTVFVIILILSGLAISDILSAFINPEYWAFRHLITN